MVHVIHVRNREGTQNAQATVCLKSCRQHWSGRIQFRPYKSCITEWMEDQSCSYSGLHTVLQIFLSVHRGLNRGAPVWTPHRTDSNRFGRHTDCFGAIFLTNRTETEPHTAVRFFAIPIYLTSSVSLPSVLKRPQMDRVVSKLFQLFSKTETTGWILVFGIETGLMLVRKTSQT